MVVMPYITRYSSSFNGLGSGAAPRCADKVLKARALVASWVLQGKPRCQERSAGGYETNQRTSGRQKSGVSTELRSRSHRPE
jgi:hypothetical protein